MAALSDVPTHLWARKFPELGTGPVSNRPCVSLEYFELERERVFKRVWLNVGRVDEIPNPGDFLVRDLAVCKTSLLVVRGADGGVRAFHNVCSHRGNQVSWREKGNCRSFTCKFHGWTYDLDGKLVGVTDEANFFGLNKAENGLTPVAADTWEGFIFVNLDPNPAESLRDYLGEVADHLEGYPFDKLTTRYTYQADERVNWKVLLDAQQEGYHVPFLHRLTFVKAVDNWQQEILVRSVDVKLFKCHRLVSVGGSGQAPGSKLTPVEELARRYGATTLAAMGGASHGGQQGTKLVGTFDFWVIFPNFVMALMDGTYFTYNLWPLAVDHTVWEIRTYYPPARNAGERFSQEFAKCTLRDPLLEDGSVHERIQAMLGSGAKSHFILQDEEIAVRHGYKVVADYVGE
jgi:phenylpropionate dioxygenase-like ring-hydroxylating dioxygenase large terminal subunit